MKTTFLHILKPIVFIILLTFLFCEKRDYKHIIKITTDEITYSVGGVSIAGSLVDAGENGVSDYGICWSDISTEPDLSDNKSGQGLAESKTKFSITLTGIAPNKDYYVRTFAQYQNIIEYGEVKSFNLPGMSITTGDVENINYVATATGTIDNIGLFAVLQHGHCWSKINSQPNIGDSKTQAGTASVAGGFNSQLTGIEVGTNYYIRAYITNEQTTEYGSVATFTIPDLTINMGEVVATGESTANATGEILHLGLKQITEYGHCWSSQSNLPSINNSVTTKGQASQEGAFTSGITGLAKSTTYYIRAYAVTSEGLHYSSKVITYE